MLIKRTLIASAVAAMFCVSPDGWADDMQDIRNEIRAIKDSYESRIKALEDRLKDAETKAEKAETSAAKAKTKAQEMSAIFQREQEKSVLVEMVEGMLVGTTSEQRV